MRNNEIRSKETSMIDTELKKLRRDLFRLKIRKASGQTVKTHEFKSFRHTIARMKTILNERLREK